MNRSKQYKKRETKPDSVLNSVLVHRFIGKLMLNGKKLKVSNFVYNALNELAAEKQQDVVFMFEECVKLLHPQHRLRLWRIASKLYPLPYLIKDPMVASKQAIHWLAKAIQKRKERGLKNKIVAEIRDIFNGSGIALTFVQKRKELAIEYEAYVHYGS